MSKARPLRQKIVHHQSLLLLNRATNWLDTKEMDGGLLVRFQDGLRFSQPCASDPETSDLRDHVEVGSVNWHVYRQQKAWREIEIWNWATGNSLSVMSQGSLLGPLRSPICINKLIKELICAHILFADEQKLTGDPGVCQHLFTFRGWLAK